MTTKAQANDTTTVDALYSLAQIFLASAERLSALNLTTAHETIEANTAAAKAVLQATSVEDLGRLRSMTVQPLFENALSYSRSAYEILAKTHEQTLKLFTSQISAPKSQLITPFELFTKSVQRMSAIAAENVAAAADASSKAIDSSKSHVKKAA